MLKGATTTVSGTRTLAAGTLLAAVLLVLYFVDPSRLRLLPPCPVHWATGLYCPGCGSTRALHCFLHGHLAEAMAKNPLAVVSIPFIILLCLRPAVARNRLIPWVVLVIVLAYAVLRNLPGYPFVLLVPH